jgi:hypothetical protein
MAHSEKMSKREMVNSAQPLSQRIICLPFTVYWTLGALRLALCVRGQPKATSFEPGAGVLALSFGLVPRNSLF